MKNKDKILKDYKEWCNISSKEDLNAQKELREQIEKKEMKNTHLEKLIEMQETKMGKLNRVNL